MFKKNNKKGISPLIATVIIIGFTIVLAALVIQFGTGFVKQTTEGAEKSSAFNQLCSIGLSNLDVKASWSGEDIKVVLDNKNQAKLFGAVLRIYGSDATDVVTTTLDEEIETFSIANKVVAASDYLAELEGTPKNVGVLVKVKLNEEDTAEEEQTCPNEFKTGITGAAPAAP